MRTSIIFTVLLLVVAGSLFAANTLKIDRDFSMDSFVGYVDNQVIVVLTEEAVNSLNTKALQSYNVFEGLTSFDQLREKFEVQLAQPQFKRAHRNTMAAASSERQELSRYFKVSFNSAKATLDEVIAAYEALPEVDRVEKDAIHRLMAAPNDTYYDNPPPEFPYDQWHYWDTYGVNAESAWNAQTGDATVVVGILDSGVRYYHGDLGGSDAPGPNDNVTNGNIWVNPGETPGDGIDNDGNGYVDDVIGYDFVETTGGFGVSCTDDDCGTKDNDPADHNGHGTHVAGTVGAITNNGRQVAGVAGGWGDGTYTGTATGVKLVPCRIGYTGKYRGQEGGFVIMSSIAEAMTYMGDLKASGVNVAAVNCSWGSSNSGGLGAAVDYILSQDVMVIVAAGNANSSSPDYLGGRSDCMDVGATDQNGDPASFSDYGSWVDIAAPGVSILSTYHYYPDPAGDYIALLDGTSMSCPHVVGVAALLESENSSLTAQQKWDIMVNTASAYNMTKDVGAGIVDASAAIAAAGGGGGNNPPVANFSGSPTSGTVPLTVSFTDLSSNSPTSWSWDFGDGVGTSTAQNPSYEYQSTGTYTVSLTAANQYGSDNETKVAYITVSDPPQGGTMHVHDIVVTREQKGPNVNGVGTITIFDGNEQPVANATVTVVATGPTGGTGSAQTGADGTVSFQTSKLKNPSGEWCFEVTDVTHASNSYLSGDNHVTKACESGVVFSDGAGAMTNSLNPNSFGLAQNYPNPFNPTTEISFSLPTASHVTLEVFNIAGQKVSVLTNDRYDSGTHTVNWDASSMPSGIYLYRLTTNSFVDTKKMLLMK